MAYHKRIRKTWEQRFFAKVEKTASCWLWTAGKSDGYGDFDGTHAHRFLYQKLYGTLPADVLVMHTCDVRACVNPAHLKAGSVNDNNQDMVAKDRQARGNMKPNAKLTPELVNTIRSMYKPKVFGYDRISAALGLSKQTVADVLTGESWKWYGTNAG